MFRVEPFLIILGSKYQSTNTLPGWLVVSPSLIVRDIHLRW